MKIRLLTFVLFGLCGMTLFTSANGQDAANAEHTELAVGDAAPDFTLKTFDDKTVVLSERFAGEGREGKPVVLLFSRANW